ncbi:DNA cytosine methyltransferase [Erwinia psidii]|uniref:Cytosine-specific methyltransferase n=1 Tax=Erwinia psidii TaxID=69224 RepID=A0A3N6RV65_9GAMM|nr:DNA (cytosine-5-)-methyltransferase [Erwinia psidii]RQM36838.1 DNA (cytosine-5-)-methyltransferase [Erwinia psidii]
MPKAVSLFSGCGGSDAGLVKAGFDVVMANDILPYAKEVYLANQPETDYLLGDIRKVTSFPDAELLVGCYPCQGFSQGGVRQADRSINFLYKEFARALSLIKPKAFIVENVSGMRNITFQHLLKDQLERFSSATDVGYDVDWKVIHAHHYGVPQERKRLIIVGIRNDLGEKYQFPEPTHGDGAPEPFVTIGEALKGLPEWPVGEYCDDVFHWYYLSRNRRRDWNEVSKTIVSNLRHIPLHPVSPELKKIETDKWSFVNEKPARRFSFREAAILQGFSKEYTKHGADLIFPDVDYYGPNTLMKERYKVVGNAVPPPLFEAVVKSMPDIWSEK